MFRIFERKLLMSQKDQTKHDQEMEQLLGDEKKVDLIVLFAAMVLCGSLAGIFLDPLVEHENNFIRLIGSIFSIIFVIGYIKVFFGFTVQLAYKGCFISNFLFFSIYTSKGNAILREDFKKIKEVDKELYQGITTRKCIGACVVTCFHILRVLQKGSIKLMAVRALTSDDIPNYFTLHTIYVNNNDCFDTFSRKQYPVDWFMELNEAREFRTYSYQDIQGKSYSAFVDEFYSELTTWCKKNDCYIKVA